MMNRSLQALCEAIKKISAQLKPQNNPCSFVIMVGHKAQGKSAVLRQSQLEELCIDGAENTKLYYNQRGIIVELDSSWLQEKESLIKNALKNLNRCHRALKINGIILCIDTKELALTEPLHIDNYANSQLQLLEQLNKGLHYSVENFILFTKLDALAGFCEFYQTEHDSDLAKALGFTINPLSLKDKTIEVYNQRFNQLIELLGQQVIQKLHPARSTIKRTLIREFPLQLLSLRKAIQLLIQKAASKHINLQAIYFTSAEQGGQSIDRLNEKIHHEYALTIQDTIPQAANYRAFFIEDAIKTIQMQCNTNSVSIGAQYKNKAIIAAGIAGLTLIALAYNHFKTTQLLDETSKELLAYETLLLKDNDKTPALYHLSQAEDKLKHTPTRFLVLPILNELKIQLHHNAKQRLNHEFMPSVTAELESVINSPSQSAVARYKALKIYLMLSQPEHFSEAEVLRWFDNHWRSQSVSHLNKKLSLLKQIISLPLQKFSIQEQYVSDARNYLNALPATYLYYSLAKESFSPEINAIDIKGFKLARQTLPAYYTKAGFNQVIHDLPDISAQLINDQWVLAGQNSSKMHEMLLQAYCYDYSNWWKSFIKHAHPSHFQNYQQGRQVFQKMNQGNAIEQFINFVQLETSAELKDGDQLFNQNIASQFTDLNLINQYALRDLAQNISDMEKFMTTLSFVNDGGYTAFNLSKARFNDSHAIDPVTTLYRHTQRLPEPVAGWAKQLADDSWSLLINDTRGFINQQWQQTVYLHYKEGIAQRYPLSASEKNDISLYDFKRFFARQGILNQFVQNYLKPFLDTSTAQWQPKSLNGYMLPVSNEAMNELIRANIISNMFFPTNSDECKIDFSLQKINLDPIIGNLELTLGATRLQDNQESDSYTRFRWPQSDARLALDSIDGNHYELAEKGPWALFRLLDKVNVFVDENDSTNLQILFEINSNSGRYVMKTNNPVNPFTPGILNGFSLQERIV